MESGSRDVSYSNKCNILSLSVYFICGVFLIAFHSGSIYLHRQAIDRTHRLGQYRPIRAVRFIAENTVEERILQLQEKKRLVFDGTVGRDAASLTMLSVDDMKNLFS